MCSWRGHVAPGAELAEVSHEHYEFARVATDGRRLVQCLRCRCWVLASEPSRSSNEHAVPYTASTLKHPRRGRALREAIIMRAIAIDKGLHAVVMLAVSVAAFVALNRLSAIRGWSQDLLNALGSARKGGGGVSSHGVLSGLLTRLNHLPSHSVKTIAIFAGVYGFVAVAETVGLWRERRWAEYLTALATGAFLPLEFDELIKRITVVRVGALVINLAILSYLVYAKHLFGFRGPLEHDPHDPLAGLPELVPVVAPDPNGTQRAEAPR